MIGDKQIETKQSWRDRRQAAATYLFLFGAVGMSPVMAVLSGRGWEHLALC